MDNKKLAKFGGFKWVEEYHYATLKRFWLYPDGTKYHSKVPNFTESLDTCFKWLWDKAIDALNEKHHFAMKETPYTILFDRMREGMFAGKPPALALCLAIEKLIDGGNDASTDKSKG